MEDDVGLVHLHLVDIDAAEAAVGAEQRLEQFGLVEQVPVALIFVQVAVVVGVAHAVVARIAEVVAAIRP